MPFRQAGPFETARQLEGLDFDYEELEDWAAASLSIEPGTSRDHIYSLPWARYVRHMKRIEQKIKEHNKNNG